MKEIKTKFSSVLEASSSATVSELMIGDEAKTIIISNGSRMASESRATIDELIEVLKEDPLDLTFMRYGGFVDCCPVAASSRIPLYPDGYEMFWGNFIKVSHVFHIVTNDPEVIAALHAGISVNLSRQQMTSFPK